MSNDSVDIKRSNCTCEKIKWLRFLSVGPSSECIPLYFCEIPANYIKQQNVHYVDHMIESERANTNDNII